MYLGRVLGPQKVYMFYACFSNNFIRVCLSQVRNGFITFCNAIYKVVNCNTKQLWLFYYQKKETLVTWIWFIRLLNDHVARLYQNQNLAKRFNKKWLVLLEFVSLLISGRKCKNFDHIKNDIWMAPTNNKINNFSKANAKAIHENGRSLSEITCF